MNAVTLITTGTICRVEVLIDDTRHSAYRFGPHFRENGRALAAQVASALRECGSEAALSVLFSDDNACIGRL